MIDSRVDLPPPDGPAMVTKSPLSIWRWTSDRAWVSTSSVRNTFLTPAIWMSEFLSVICVPPVGYRNSDLFVLVPAARIGQDHPIALAKAVDDFDRFYRSATQTDLNPKAWSPSGSSR